MNMEDWVITKQSEHYINAKTKDGRFWIYQCRDMNTNEHKGFYAETNDPKYNMYYKNGSYYSFGRFNSKLITTAIKKINQIIKQVEGE